MKSNSYNRFPQICGSTLFFVTDDDIWRQELDPETFQAAGLPMRLTTSHGRVVSVSLSPDGSQIAYTSNDSSEFDVYLIPSTGGQSKRISYFGDGLVCAWFDEKHVVIATSSDQKNLSTEVLKKVHTKSGRAETLACGPAGSFAQLGKSGEKKWVIGRHTDDLGRWKGYRGGMIGALWVDRTGSGQFQRILQDLDSNIANPITIQKRIYFIADFEGTGNIYSCDPRGRDLTQITDHEGLYVRQIATDGNSIVYQRGGEIFLLPDPESEPVSIALTVPGSFRQTDRHYTDAMQNLQDFDVNSDGSDMAIVSRGQLFILQPWIGAPIAIRHSEVERFRSVTWGGEELLWAVAVDFNGEDILLKIDRKKRKVIGKPYRGDWGKIYEICPSPDQKRIAIASSRYSLVVLQIGNRKSSVIDRGVDSFDSLDWSPDSNWLVYHKVFEPGRSCIRIYNAKTAKARDLIEPMISDSSPAFDPSGEYIFFIGAREFYPGLNETHFEHCYPKAKKPYAVRLQKGLQSLFDLPFVQDLDDPEDLDEPKSIQFSSARQISRIGKQANTSTSKQASKKKTKAVGKKASGASQQTDEKKQPAKEKVRPVKIDFEGIDERIEAFPGDLGGYECIFAGEDRVFWLRSFDNGGKTEHEQGSDLYAFSFKEGEAELVEPCVGGVCISEDRRFLLYESKRELRLVPSDCKPTDGSGYCRKDGWIDLVRIRVPVDPKAEWLQMFKEAWVLQREFFWTESMSDVDWLATYKRYRPLLDRIHTRAELSDLIWEMQGDLGTSHCYEYAGEYLKRGLYQTVAKLGVDLKFESRSKSFQIEKIYGGDSWCVSSSPLIASEVELKKGDRILEVEGVPLDSPFRLYEQLENRTGLEMELTVQRSGSKKTEQVSVVPISNERPARYLDWVDQNRKKVHKATKNRVGYIHIPDMTATGHAEFFRQLLQEAGKETLIIDVRFNLGGYVSEVLLRILSQKLLGYNLARWTPEKIPYPSFSTANEKVLLINEQTASDGDIFSHAFRLLELGPIVGKRTWGGVIGTLPRIGLVDGSITTQPEFNTWFHDVGLGLENQGIEPDYEIEIAPQDWVKGKDPQLEKAIELIQKSLKKMDRKQSQVGHQRKTESTRRRKLRLDEA